MSEGRWSEVEWRRAFALARAGATASDIALALDRGRQSVYDAFAARGRAGMLNRGLSRNVGSLAPSAAVLAARDARYAASLRRTQTQEFFGDPPPGFSALDRKRQGMAP